LAAHNIEIAPLRPANNGFICAWSEHIKALAGSPLKSVSLSFINKQGQTETRQGELIITEQGVEGSLIYAFSVPLRDQLEQSGFARFYLDLCPHQTQDQIQNQLAKRPSKKSLSNFLKNNLKLNTIKIALLFEKMEKNQNNNPVYIAQVLKQLPITVTATTPLDEAISTAGGVRFEALNSDLMLEQVAGVFCAGEMLDWEAPTGGYLLTACFATGKQAGLGAIRYLQQNNVSPK
jgi:hypothetical protein